VKNIKNNKRSKKKILCLIEHYLPGHKLGGPVRTIANFVEYFGDNYDISIVSLDHDYLAKKSYSNKDFSKWHKIGKAKVFYIPKKIEGLVTITKILKGNTYELLYLNGLFSIIFTIFPLVLRKLNLAPKNIPCVIAPRGMFSRNALKLKYVKKCIFFIFTELIGLYKNIIFHASNKYEKRDIYRKLNDTKIKVFVAPNLTSKATINLNQIKLKKRGFLRLVFLSRIDPMKNLDLLIIISNYQFMVTNKMKFIIRNVWL
jgi:glycosyltransferase involved in cell wall biosynthesis